MSGIDLKAAELKTLLRLYSEAEMNLTFHVEPEDQRYPALSGRQREIFEEVQARCERAEESKREGWLPIQTAPGDETVPCPKDGGEYRLLEFAPVKTLDELERLRKLEPLARKAGQALACFAELSLERLIELRNEPDRDLMREAIGSAAGVSNRIAELVEPQTREATDQAFQVEPGAWLLPEAAPRDGEFVGKLRDIEAPGRDDLWFFDRATFDPETGTWALAKCGTSGFELACWVPLPSGSSAEGAEN